MHMIGGAANGNRFTIQNPTLRLKDTMNIAFEITG